MSKRYLLALILVGLFIIGFIALSKSIISNESSNYAKDPWAGTVYDRRPDGGWGDEGQREHAPCDPGLEKHKRPFGPTTGFGKYGP